MLRNSGVFKKLSGDQAVGSQRHGPTAVTASLAVAAEREPDCGPTPPGVSWSASLSDPSGKKKPLYLNGINPTLL